MVQDPPSRLLCEHRTVAAGTRLGRIHDLAFQAAQFNPGLKGDTRFAPIDDATGKRVPTLYAGSSYMCACFEYVFHDIDPSASFKTVPLASVEPLNYSVLAPTRELSLVKLFEPDLNRWQRTRSEIIDTPRSHYIQTRKWAEAVHASSPDADGMIWTSKRCDPDTAIILFGDRVFPAELQIQSTTRIINDRDLLEELRAFGRTADITLTF